MPYLIKTQREIINEEAHLNTLSNYLSNQEPKNFAGQLNYCNFKIVKDYIHKNGQKYWIFSIIVGTLFLCVLEIWRKIIVDYEDLKEKENGSIE